MISRLEELRTRNGSYGRHVVLLFPFLFPLRGFSHLPLFTLVNRREERREFNSIRGLIARLPRRDERSREEKSRAWRGERDIMNYHAGGETGRARRQIKPRGQKGGGRELARQLAHTCRADREPIAAFLAPLLIGSEHGSCGRRFPQGGLRQTDSLSYSREVVAANEPSST